MEISEQKVLELLRDRGNHDEAEAADGEWPDAVDTDRDAGLLTKFGVHPPGVAGRLVADVRGEERSHANAQFCLQTLQHEVASAALTGNPYNEIEERVIGPSPLSDEEKAALRLYSCSFLYLASSCAGGRE